VSLAKLALLQRPALAIGVPGEPDSLGAVAADGALCRILAGYYLDLSGHALFLVEPRILGCDTLILAERNPYERLDVPFVPLGFGALAHVSRKT
jgi:hypothetical protein